MPFTSAGCCSVSKQSMLVSPPLQPQNQRVVVGRSVACCQATPCSGRRKAVSRQTICQSAEATLQRAVAAMAAGVLSLSGQALAFEFPNLPGGPPIPPSTHEERAKVFEESDFLRNLRDRTNANKAKNKKDLEDKYCYRQAELGVGDCAGLRLIPGATKSGKQQTPEWLANIIGKGKEAASDIKEDVQLPGAE